MIVTLSVRAEPPRHRVTKTAWPFRKAQSGHAGGRSSGALATAPAGRARYGAFLARMRTLIRRLGQRSNTSRAAKITAALLEKESTLPEPLRRSLAIALSACGQTGLEGDDREARAAARFVEACRALCTRG